MPFQYQLIIIGGGISACTFVSETIKNGFNARIAIIENGRGLGGRSSTRISNLNNESVIDHGAPHFNLTNNTCDSLLNEFINDLLFKNLIKKDDSYILKINENLQSISRYKNEFYEGNIFKSNGSMSNLSKSILNLHNRNNQIDFYFNKTITEFKFNKGKWILSTNNNEKFECNFLVSSSNLIAHPRSIKILQKKQVPLRSAISPNKSQIIDEIISLLENQKFCKRTNILFFLRDKRILKENYLDRNLHILFNQRAQKEIGFERVIFQKQIKNFHNIVFHSQDNKLINKFISRNDQKGYIHYCLNCLEKILKIHNLSDNQVIAEDFSLMFWRASQPNEQGIPDRLQICKEFNIAFCGDWFNFEGFGRVEGAIISALKLSKKLNELGF